MATTDGDVSRNIGTELIFENDRIRVWNMTLEPGESSDFHRHDYDYVYCYTTPSRITSTGQPGVVREYDEHFVQYRSVGEGIEHKITNLADIRHNQILVELKGPSASTTPETPEDNGRVHLVS